MRLIDADKIGLTDFEIIMCQGDYREAFKMLLDKINNQATVNISTYTIPSNAINVFIRFYIV